MNPYDRKRRWKFILIAFALIIVGASLWYTDYLVRNISNAERTRAELWARSTRNIIAMPDVNDEYITFIYSMRDSLAVPAIVVDSAENIITWRGLDSTKTNFDLEADSKKKYDPKYFKSQLKEMKSQHPQPIVLELNNRNNEKWYVYYKDSTLLTQLRAFPYLQLSIIAIFLLIAYGVFNSSRKSEQDQVWVGLAKETAHQLGTPISSLMAWVELLKSKFNAIEGQGSIKVEIKENLVKEQVFIDITDTGAGIPRLKFDTVFQPGYTTRKRGWGLGLSLTKRIVENYHQGSIFVKDSELGRGTTFRIVLKSNMTYEATTS